MLLNKKLLERILYGSAFLGSGGGGAICSGKKFISEIGEKKVKLITNPNEEENKFVACIVCDIGSITAFDPKQSAALNFAFTALSENFKTSLGAIRAFFPIETGPENTLAAFVLGAKCNMPIIDGDGAGRAVPTLPLSTFSIDSVNNPQPVAISNGNGDLMLVKTDVVDRFDNLLRSVAGIETFSNSASLALWPDTVETLINKSIKGSITKALYCGQLLQGIRENNNLLIKKSLKIVNQLQGYLIAAGEVIYKTGKDEGAFNFTTTKIKNLVDKSIITIISQNESLIAFSDKQSEPIAIAPDSICYLQSDFCPCTNVEIRETGTKKMNSKHNIVQKIYLIGVKAHQKLHHPKIKDGFKKIIEQLGYAGNMNIHLVEVKPLGDLFIELGNNFLF